MDTIDAWTWLISSNFIGLTTSFLFSEIRWKIVGPHGINNFLLEYVIFIWMFALLKKLFRQEQKNNMNMSCIGGFKHFEAKKWTLLMPQHGKFHQILLAWLALLKKLFLAKQIWRYYLALFMSIIVPGLSFGWAWLCSLTEQSFSCPRQIYFSYSFFFFFFFFFVLD